MSEHLSSEQITGLLARQLPSTKLLAALNHLHTCAACRAQIGAADATEARVASLRAALSSGAQPSAEHLSYEELAGYVDETLAANERQLANEHLAACEPCLSEVRGLTELRDQLAALPALQSLPTSRLSWGARLKNFRLLPIGEIRPLAALLTVLLLAVLGATWFWRQATTSKQIELTQHKPAAAASQTTPPAPNPEAAAQASPPAASAAVAWLMDHGQRITLDRAGRLSGLPALDEDDEQAIKVAMQQQRAPVATGLAELAGPAGALLSRAEDHAALTLLTPVGTVVQSDRPTLSWQPVDGAASYRVTVLDTDFKLVCASESLSTAHWTLPRPLRRNSVYLWQVTAQVNGQELSSASAALSEARFKVLAQTQVDKLNAAARRYANSHLALGTLYARAGLFAEARREFQSLRQANPQSALARNLLRHLPAPRH